MPFEPAASAPLPPQPVSAPPVTVGSLLSRTFSTWWKRMWIFAATTLVLLLPVYAFQFGIVTPRFQEDPQSAGWAAIVFAVLAMLATMVLACGHTYGAVRHLSGKSVRFGTMLSVALGRFFPVIGLLLLGLVAYVVFAFGVALPAGFLIAFLGWFGGVLVFLVVVPFAIFIGTALSLTIPVMVAERAGPFTGLRRSWQLTRGRRGAIFLTLFLIMLVMIGAMLAQLGVVSAVTGASMMALNDPSLSFEGPALAATVVTGLVQMLLTPLFTVVPAVAYHDLRIEKEGVATDDLARVFE